MKKQIVLLGIFLSIALFSCENTSDDLKEDKQELLTDLEIKQIGIQHNQALEYLFENLSTNKEKSTVEIDLIVNKHLNNLYRENITDVNEVKTAIEYSEKETSNYFDKNFLSKTKSNDNTPIAQVVDDNKNNISPLQIKYLLECDDIIANSSDDVNIVVENLNKLQEKIKDELDQGEAQVLLASIEIGKNSIVYWNENLDLWKEKFQNGTTKSWWSWKEVGGSDVAGGAGAAIGAAVVNLAPGAGQIAYGGAILGGAVGGSAASTVKQLWDHYI